MRDAGMRDVRLIKDVRASLEAGHPWIYRDALGPLEAEAGTLVRVVDRGGAPLAFGFADDGVIGVRVVAHKRSELEGDVVHDRLSRALTLRTRLLDQHTTAFRWVHGEADRLPGVVIDLYDAWAVVRFDSLGAERWAAREGHAALAARMAAIRPGLRGVLVRSGRGESKVGRVGHGEGRPGLVSVREHGMALLVDLRRGQKTGLFLDHRESRRRIRELSGGRRVLNLYGYTGGFSIAAGLGGAVEVDTVDVAEQALSLARSSWDENALPDVHRTYAEDVPRFLEFMRDARRSFDLIIGDPPSFAPNETAVPNAMRSYRALHRACLRLLAPGGLYLAASCSSHVGSERFDRTIREAVEKVPRHVRILERWGGAADHPRMPAFPEGDYLKCVLLAVD